MRSMTGFGCGEAVSPDGKIKFRTEIFAVNRRQFELKLTLPKELTTAEPVLRNLVGARVSRGALSLRVETVFLSADVSALTIDRRAALALLAQLRTIGQEAGLDAKPRPESLLALPGIIVPNGGVLRNPAVLETLKKSCSAALDALIRARETEGENLRRKFVEQLALLAATVDRIEPLAAAIPAAQRAKLLKRLKESGLALDVNDDRALRELVIFAARSDVTEEITRLRSHFRAFRAALDSKSADEPAGRRLDFLLQEIFREINTLGNKAPTPEISPLVVLLKIEVEKIREQVQNIE